MIKTKYIKLNILLSWVLLGTITMLCTDVFANVVHLHCKLKVIQYIYMYYLQNY